MTPAQATPSQTDYDTLVREFRARQRRERWGLILGAGTGAVIALAGWMTWVGAPALPTMLSAAPTDSSDALAAMLAERSETCAAPAAALAAYRRTPNGQQDRLENDEILPAIRGFCTAFGTNGAPRQPSTAPGAIREARADAEALELKARVVELEAKLKTARKQGAAEMLARMPGVSLLP